MSAAPAPVADAGPLTEITLTAQEFNELARRVQDMTGIVLPEQKRQLVQTRLSKRLRSIGLTSFAEYAKLLNGPKQAEELGELVNVMTTNLTSFFREGHHFEHLHKHVLMNPAGAGGGKRRIRIWSAGCSTGEEPYSIAATVLSASSDIGAADLKLLATDLDTDVLNRAANGIYKAERLKKAPPPMMKRLFPAPPDQDENVKVCAEARKLISFKQLNLLHRWPMSGPFDAIFCRNVMIYFNTEVKKDLVNRYVGMLSPGAFLYLGHSESLLGDHPQLISEGRTVFRKKDPNAE